MQLPIWNKLTSFVNIAMFKECKKLKRIFSDADFKYLLSGRFIDSIGEFKCKLKEYYIRSKSRALDVPNSVAFFENISAKVFREIGQSQGIDLAKVLYVGNDVNDLDAMRLVGYPVLPADAHPQVLAIAKYVTQARGGEGVIKELAEW